MNKFVFYTLTLACLLFFPALFAQAQTRITAEPAPDEAQIEQPAKRPNLLRELNLTPEQIRQVRQINQERKISRPAAQQKLKAANEALDQAMYADADNEAEVQARLREVQTAQLEVLKNRVNYERSIKRVLTAQQLGRFRELRRQFKQVNNPNADSRERLDANADRVPNARRQRRLKRLANRQRQQQ